MSQCLDLKEVSAKCIGPSSPRKWTSGSLAIIPGVRFEANACNDVENSESAPSAGCTDRTTLLHKYAILATSNQLTGQSMLHTHLPQGEKRGGPQKEGDVPASPAVATEAMILGKL